MLDDPYIRNAFNAYHNGTGDPLVIKIRQKDNDLWITTLITLNTGHIYEQVTHEKPFDGRWQIYRHIICERQRWNQLYRAAIIDLSNNYAQHIKYIDLRTICECGSNYGYYETNTTTNTRCLNCHKASGIHSKWEKHETNEHPRTNDSMRTSANNKDADTCYLCKQKVNDTTIDHQISIKDAITHNLNRVKIHNPNNSRIACRSCNSRKGSTSL